MKHVCVAIVGLKFAGLIILRGCVSVRLQYFALNCVSG